MKLALFKKEKTGTEDNNAKLVACGEDCNAGLWFRAKAIPATLMLETKTEHRGIRVGIQQELLKNPCNEEGFEVSQLVI